MLPINFGQDLTKSNKMRPNILGIIILDQYGNYSLSRTPYCQVKTSLYLHVSALRA